MTGEARIEARLLAPCCFAQTLDVHESEIAAALRREIHDRLAAGETATAVEDDLVARYGAEMRAVPRDQAIGGPIPAIVGVGVALAAIGLGRLLRGWLRRSASRPVSAPPAARDRYDDRLDEELRALEGDP